jgi:hypothetical protein
MSKATTKTGQEDQVPAALGLFSSSLFQQNQVLSDPDPANCGMLLPQALAASSEGGGTPPSNGPKLFEVGWAVKRSTIGPPVLSWRSPLGCLGSAMTNFEEVGRKIDQEMERLRKIAEEKISPATRVKAASALRSVSEKLSRLAEEVESKSDPQEK